VGASVTESVDVPTIGIGAGPHCDGQVLVFHDLLGFNRTVPKFVRRYAEMGDGGHRRGGRLRRRRAVGAFPGDAEVYH
jgi:3-methyl-2-oxobutanoate hydroxymethyltransferase